MPAGARGRGVSLSELCIVLAVAAIGLVVWLAARARHPVLH